MLTLGIDTATKVCSVALCRDAEVLASYNINIGRTHSEGLVPQLDEMLRRCKMKPSDLELIAVSQGPGSFTGLRIGLATVEAMSYSLKIPLVGVDTLEALAYNLPIAGIILAPVLDAQKGNYYLALYEWQQGVLVQLEATSIVAGNDVQDKLAAYNKPVIVLGEGAKLKDNCSGQVSLGAAQVRMPQAVSVALAGQIKVAQGQVNDCFHLVPTYIRRSEAEELWEKRTQK